MTSAADWSGRVGEVWAEEWPRTERAFSGLEPALEAAVLTVAPDHGRFLDIGCGVGTTSLAVARARPGAEVLGIDLSPGMVAIAQDRASSQSNARFACTDVLELIGRPTTPRPPGLEPASRFSSSDPQGAAGVDVLFSRHGVMFFPDPVDAFRHLQKAATPGAALAFSCFASAADNPWANLLIDAPPPSSSYAPGPFAFADEGLTHNILAAAGWRDLRAERVGFRYLAGEGADPAADALALFTRIGPAASLLRAASPAERPALIARLADRVAAHRSGDVVDFPAAAWLWSARA